MKLGQGTIAKWKHKRKQQREVVKRGQLAQIEKDKSITFTDRERIIVEIITKCDFSKCGWYYHEDVFYYNNLKLKYCKYSEYSNSAQSCFGITRQDNHHSLHNIALGKAKQEIVDNIIADKKLAYINETIVTALNSKQVNPGDCTYCGTHNAEDKINCINCGVILTTRK